MQTIAQSPVETLKPAAPSTLVELLRERAQQCSFKPLYTFLSDGETEEVTLTYGELEERARAIGRQLQLIGAKSERVLLLFPPGLEYVAAFFGCLCAGAIAVPAYPPRLNKKQDRLLAIIADAQVSVILTTSAVREKGQPLFAESEQLKHVRWLAVDEIDLDLAHDWEGPEIGADSIAFIQYTSGSTSIPKGVMVTHGNLLHNEAMIKDAFRQSEQSIIVGWLPLYHDMGLIGNVLQPLYLGARCILMSPVAFLQRPFRWLSAISRYRATTSGGPNFAYELCLRKISREQRASLDLSSWEVAFNGAEPVRAATQESFAETFAACGFRREAFQPCYGLAEATLLVTGKHSSELAAAKGFEQRALEQNLLREVTPEDKQARVLVSNGATLSEQQVRIVNPETLIECAPDEVGEVWVSGPSVTHGYWNRPEETRQTFGAYLANTGEGPFLRTGDMGFLREAELFIAGRLKDLVIIRGLNHYPQDIELTAEESCAALRPGCGVAFSVEVEGEEQLVIVCEIERHAELDIAEAAAAVREAVAEQHEVQVYAVSLIKTGTIPKTSSGKLQRRECRARFLAGSLELVAEWRGATFDATPQTESSTSVPRTVDDIAAWLTSQLAARVGVAISEIDVNQSFARYGVDSLAAIEMAHEVETRLGICVSIVSFLESTSILQFAAELEQQLTNNTGALPLNDERKAEPVKDYALSYGQRSLWFLHNMEPSSAAYNLAGAVRIRSGLDVRALRAAFQSLIVRHASLRTTFTSQQGEPIQRVHDFMEVCFAEEDAAGWDEGVLNERLVEAAHRQFDLEHGPLLRVSLFKKSDAESILLLAIHHIVTDFWSLAVLVQELGYFYRAGTGQQEQSALPIVGQPYTEYARRQAAMLEGPEGERLWSYWKQRLSGELPALNLPIDHPRPAAQTYNGASVPFKLNADLTNALQELSRANDATLYMTLLAAFQVLLSRYTGQTKFAVGSPTAGRREAGWAWTTGYFVNPVVMRAELSGDPTFADYLKRVRQETLVALAHLDFPFPLLVERLQPERDLSRSPLFQAMFVLQKSTSDARIAELASGESGVKLQVGGLSLESVAIPKRVAQFDLTLMMAEAEGGLAASFIYNTDLFEAATISRLAGHFRTLLEGIIRNPEKRIAQLPLLTGNERRQLLIEWNKTAPVEWGTDEPAISADLLHEGFEAQAARTPHGLALVAGEERLTYAELDVRSNQLAHHLLSLGVTAESRVGLLTERNTEMVIAILAVLKAGAAYVALDPLYPHERIAFMLADSGAKVLLTHAHLSERLTGHEARTVLLDADRALIIRQPAHSPSVPVEKINLAYVIYTSGSTGRPKGVAIEHQSAVALLDWAHHNFRPADLRGVLFATSICFDLSMFELFVPLWCGGAVILADNALDLPLLPARTQVTLINTVPSAMAELVRTDSIPSSVRVVNLAGEPLTTRLAAEVYAAARVEQVWNLYGPTEDTTYSTFLLVERGRQRMTIGRPIKGTQAYVLDQSLQPVPIGVSGQLYLGGEGLARGYLARPELTAERFIPDPFSAVSGSRLYGTGDLVRYLPGGEIEYLGRMDHQVKVRGFRIELGEIESALLAQSYVKEAVVVVSPEANGTGQRLVAYVVGTESGLEVSALRRELEQRLPHYMTPSAIVVLSEMPLTPNGKIDRKALPAPERAGYGSLEESAHVGARTQLEEIVGGIWQEVLGSKEHFSVEANFFSLGGHSLLATQVLSRIDEAFQVKLPLRSIFETPTIAGLAAHVADTLKAGSHHVASPIKHVSRKAGLPLSFAQQRLWFLQQWEPVAAAYNIPAAVRLTGMLDESALARSLEEVLRRHESLRTTFQDVDGRPVQVISPPSAWSLPVIELSSLSPGEREAEAVRLARKEVQCPFDLRQGPLMRATLLRLRDDEHILLVTMHHIVSDGWSIGVFVRELTAVYNAFSTGQPPALPSLPVQYADFAYWQREQLTGEFLDEQLAYWKRQLGGSLPALELPTVGPRPARQTFNGATETFLLAPALSEALKTLSNRHGVTLFMSLLAGFQTLLHRYTGQEDILVGTPVAGRTRLETENLIGFFVNTLVLRTDLSGAPTFAELLKRVREVSLEADLHQDVPFELLVEDLQPERSLSTTPLFQVMFAMQNAPLPELSLHGLNVTPITLDSETAKFDLTLSMRETGEGLAGTFEYNTDLFDQASMTRMARHFERLLEGVLAEPGRQVRNVALLTEDERHQLLVEWNNTDAAPVSTRLLHQAFEAQVERTPQSIALIAGDEQVTYAQLNNRANQLAHHLLSLGVSRESIVGLLTERNTQMIVAMLAVLKAGAAYLPLDPQYPHERIAFMLADSGAKILLTQKHLSEQLSAHNAHLVYLDTDQQLIAQQPATALPVDVQLQVANLGYVIYTSGSTGRPKGVAIEHQSAVALLDWAHHTFSPADLQGVLFATSICFDLSIFELFVPLSCGGTVILADNALHLPLLPARTQVTLINTVPSAMAELVRSNAIPASVRVVNLAGEPLTTKLAADVYSAAHVEQVWNLYGPTEDTTYSTAVLVHADQARMTIGRPITGTQAYVLDQSLQPVPVGVSGELYLGGAGLARGYLARPELTAERFIPDPFSAASGARVYRTGDLARYQANGEIEYLGRIDHQVKVRGFRIELGEVEAVLRAQVQEAVVVARADRLVAYVLHGAEVTASELRSFLKEKLPEYMVPSAFVFVEKWPLTPSGKIDRKALPAPEQVSDESEYVAPRTTTEEKLAGIWSQLLGVDRVGIHDNFFNLGGHSLLATQVLSHVKQMLQVEISLSALFERPTIAALAAMLEESQTRTQVDKTPPLTKRNDRGSTNAFHLSYAQQRLWFLNHLEPDSPFYNMANAVRLKGPLDTVALEAALGEVVRRHEALRTVFTLRDEEPVQVVLSDIELEMSVHDLRHLTGATVEAEVKRFFDKESQRPFNLSHGPLLRVTLLRLSETEHVALLVVHHIVSDGWSMGVLVREIAALYEAFLAGQPSPLEEPAVQYADFAEWQREWLTGDVLEEHMKYWRDQLAAADTSLEMPVDRPRPARQTFRGAELPVTLSPELTAALRELGSAQGATMFMTLLAAFQVLLYRYTNQEDVSVGTPIANRNRAEIEGLIGFFVNTLVLRADLSGDPAFRQLLERARAVALGAYAHQDLPFEKLVEELQPERSLSRNPLFQVMFALQNAPSGELALRGLTLNVEEFPSSFTRFDLELHLREQEGGLRGQLIYSTDLFDETTMLRLLSHFETLLESIVRLPDERISRIALLSEDEARQIIYKWNQETAEFPRDLCVHEMFALQVERTPENIAVEFEGVTVSYAELNQRANQLARYLRQRGVGPDVPAGIMMQRSIEMTVAVLGILKAGGAYLPLDPEYPQERLSFMLEDSGAQVLLTDTKTVSKFPQARVQEVIRLDADWDHIAADHGESLAGAQATPLNLAYVMYTSGSTGRPKGVGMTHRPLVNIIEWQLARSAWAGRPLRTLQFTSLSFDISFQELFSTWLSGATLVLVSEEVRRDSRELLRMLVKERVERLFQPYIALQYLAEAAEQDGIVPQHLREVITAGEQLKITRPIRNLFNSLNGCRLDNQYGPTEAHVVSSFMLDGPTSEWPELPPIGRPVANVQLYVLDACMQPVPVGVPGELYIGGEALARGYIGHAKASAEKFVPHPFDTGDSHSRLYRTGDVARYLPDGNIAFMGRRDQQVKVRGYRVEVSEVETALRGCEQVSEAVVVAHEGARGEKRLVAYVLPGAEVTASELRSLLKEKLPEYMVPSAFVFVEKWPLTPSGKINRKALPAPEQGSDESEYVAPRTTTEEKLAGIWSRLLGVERVGIHDSFFNLGGHSLLATQLMSRVRESFGIELPLRSLFEEPAIEGFAQTVERELRAEGKATREAAPLRPMLREGDLPLSFAQQRMWFIDKLGIGGTAYSLAGAIRLTGALDVAALGQSINEVIRRHEVLRTTFKVVDGEPVQVISAFQPSALSPVDLRDMSEAEREGEGESTVRRLFTEEAQKPFDLAHGPLIRLRLLRTSEREHVLIVNMHHIISDGWSMRVLVDEVATLYAAFMNGAPSPLAELAVQYADYAQWQRQWLQGEVLDAQLNYWRKQLEGASPVLDLPTDRPRPAIQSWRGAKQPLTISAALNAQLQALAQREGVTLYMLLLAAFQTLLYRYTGQRDISVGSPVAGRHELETEGLIGLFINMLVMRARLDGDASFRQLLDQARATALEAYAHQDVPFEKLVEELKSERDLSHAPLFQVMFVLHNAPREAVCLPGLSLEPIESDSGTARYDLTLELSERADVLEGWFEYNTDLFDASTVERMCEHLLTLLAAVAGNPSLRLSELPVLTTEERRRMLVEWNDTATDYSTHALVHQFFEEHAARTPGRTAVIFEDSELSYGDLNRRANQLAHHLSAMGVKPGGRVGISIERSLDLMVGLLGILKAGAAYVPLDPSYPRGRLAFMLADAEVNALLTQRRLLAQLPEQDARVVCIDTDWPVIAQQQETNPANHLSPENLAYIIYTSGSTGKPKGVMVTHSNLSNFFTGMDQRLLDKDSGGEPGTWLAVTSISFDISVLELFWTLARGWRVVIVGVALRGHPSVEVNPGVATEGHPYNDSRPMEFSLFYFASSESQEASSSADKYRLLIEGARFADEHDFTAVWTPERHFHAFGGLYPNPSVISASLALITKKVGLRAGSVVLPLHPAIRVAEEWAVVDNLSGGRVGVSFASGWHANDFVLEPESYAERQKVMYERIEEVRRLWRGEALTLRDGAGTETLIRTLPRPVQEELPIWVTAAGSVETFRSAGKIGAGLLTHLLGQNVDDLAEKISAYREAWREAGHEGEGHVSLMLHTYVGEEMEQVREVVRGPFCDYLMQSIGLARNLTRSLGYDLEIESLSHDELKAILTRGFDRYFETSGLMGTPESCLRMINRLKAIGVDEVACLIDFGVAVDDVMTSLKHLNEVRELSNPKNREAAEMDFSIPAQIARHGVTHLQCTPSMARMLLLDPMGAGALSSLKKLLVGGEELPASLAAELAHVVTGEIHNMYGPTETTIWSTSHEVKQVQGAVPIGRPIANTEIYILDSHLQPVPAGVHGDLFIGGAGVVQGYFKRPELTSERFIPDPFAGQPGARLYRTGDAASYSPDGTIQFWGRTDNQVKLRGYRMELGEIEAVLAEHPAVREAAVVARTAESGEPSLVAYLVAASAADFPARRMAAEAETLLGERPRYTLPNGMTIAHHSSPQTSAIYREIFEDRVYARHGITFNDGDCIFDVGSNIGLFTLFANQMCRNPRIFAFEPIPPTFDILRTNVSLYDLDVKLFELAMADKVDVASFTFYREASGLSGRTDYAANDKQTTKTVITNWFSQVAAGQNFEADEQSRLDELMDEMMRGETFDCRLSTLSNVIRENGVEHIDLLKIDVEGGELDVLNGIEEADWAKIKQVVLEVDTEDLLRQVSFKLETHGFHLAVDKTTTVREGAEYFYTVYATRTPQNGNSNGAPAALLEQPASALSTAELRSFLMERLPEYMVPSTFVTLEALPLTPNGKVNRQALPAPESGRRSAGVVYEAPRTKAEKLVSEIWREALRVEQVGVNDNFFDLGGNSLLLVKVHTRLQEAFSRKISMVEMFRRATVGSLASYLTGEQNGKSALKQTQSRADKQTAAINTQRELMKRARRN